MRLDEFTEMILRVFTFLFFLSIAEFSEFIGSLYKVLIKVQSFTVSDKTLRSYVFFGILGFKMP